MNKCLQKTSNGKACPCNAAVDGLCIRHFWKHYYSKVELEERDKQVSHDYY